MARQAVLAGFSKVFSGMLPEVGIAPALGDRTCWNCAKLEDCDRSQLQAIEKTMHEYLRWREYDEVQQVKRVLAEIGSRCVAKEDVTADTIVREFRDSESRLRLRLRRAFPKVRRWNKLTTILSIPVVVAGVASQAPLVAGLGVGIAGLAQIAGNYMDILQSGSPLFRVGR